MTDLRRIPVEPFTEKSFAQFGVVVGPREDGPDFKGNASDGWLLPFEAQGGAQLMYSRFRHQPMRFSVLERHFGVTQGFVPLNGTPLVMVVAPPTSRTGPDAAPRPDSLRAFLLDGTRGLLMHDGVWHTLDRYPVRPPHVDVLFLTARATQEELMREQAGGPKPVLTELHDFADAGIAFEVAGV
ncbi:MAG: ureidoglycolate lyase [Tagaea sp.]